MNVALVHDWLNQRGGAEYVMEVLHEQYPAAPVYTSIYWRDHMPAAYRAWDIRTTWMNRLPFVHQHHQPYLPFYPLAFRGIDLSAYDLVISNKSGFAHWVRTGGAPHICYCLTPSRYVWDFDDYVANERVPAALRAALRPYIKLLRRQDRAAADRVDHFIAISSEVQGRIRRAYGRGSTIIHPPVDTGRFGPAPDFDDYYLSLGRLVPYKRVHLAVEACTRLSLPLLVGGSGRDRERLEALAGPTVKFLGRVADADLPALYARCRAFVLPGQEDFAITPVEAQAAGRPVIASRGGGALDTVVEGETGAFFDETLESLVETLERFDPRTYDPARITANARRFDVSAFKQKIGEYVARVMTEKAERGEKSHPVR
ncbi:MAG: glycosyltransferase [Anaerolineae bacterium]|nr:glycosyltransferase [Anaerolineae bacterium]